MIVLILRSALQIMSSGYNCKNNPYNMIDLQNILLYNDMEKISNDCALYGIKFDNDNIYFQKTQFNAVNMLVSFIKKYHICAIQE